MSRLRVPLLFCLSLLPGCLPPGAPRALYGQAETREPPQVTVTENSLVLNQKIFFEFDRDVILPVSFPILDEVARTLRAHPAIARVRIEGHTDNVGTPTYNLSLSLRRARAVMRYLVGKGVAESRLEAAGFGQSQPVVDNESEEGRAQNRRVAFVIDRSQGKDGMRQAQRPTPSRQ